jgi:hypothetical protein
MIDPFGNPEDDSDDFFEAYDAVIPRVDMVKAPANGSPRFLLMKSGQGGGLIAADTIRDLLKATPKPKPQNGSTMAAKKMFRYEQGWVTSPRALTKSQLATALVKAKAKAKPQVAVFDSAGQLVGTCDADAITAIAAAPQTEDQKAQAATTANAATVSAQMNPAPAAAAADQGAQEIAKSMAGATFREDGSSSTNLTKAAGTVDDRFQNLLKSIDARHSTQMQNAVAVCALRLVAGGNASSPQAVRMSKLLACDLAAGEQARQRSRR